MGEAPKPWQIKSGGLARDTCADNAKIPSRLQSKTRTISDVSVEPNGRILYQDIFNLDFLRPIKSNQSSAHGPYDNQVPKDRGYCGCFHERLLITRRAAAAAAANALDSLVFFQLCFGDPANASRIEICLFRLHTSKATEL